MKKRLLIIILSLLTTIFFVGCGTYQAPTNSGRPGSGTSSGNTGNGGNNGGGDNNGEEGDGGDDSPVTKGYVFVVTLKNAPDTIPEDLKAVWTKTKTTKNEEFSAKFVDGVAQVSGLDGEYHVTLENLPDNYTYDCNRYEANNANRNIEIELLSIIPTRKYFNLTPNGEEKSIKWYEITSYGTYRAKVTSATAVVGFMFQPTENGSFNIQSWCDVTANKVNPILRVYNGHRNYCSFNVEIDDGGVSGTYTKNFKYNTEFDESNMGATQLFTIKASVNNIDYPVNIDFTLSRTGSYEMEDPSGEPVYATGPYATADQRKPTGTWQYLYWDNVSVGDDGKTYYIQDESKVVFNSTDGFYHVGTENGPLLYARLTKDSQVFITFDPLSESWLNLGFTYNALNGGLLALICYGYNYCEMISGTKGYANYCTTNGDGAHPVNKQIRDFLQAYASSQLLFFDGEGHAEIAELNKYEKADINPNGINLQSDENSMWLFACGYYK